jgi:feruloyl esterase
MKEAQEFPEDFDGIVAGAPAFAFNNLTSWSGSFLPLTGKMGDPKFVPVQMWSKIHEDILNQCDALDGAKDGVIEDPDYCNYDPKGLVCASGATSGCLTPLQAETVRKIYSPLKHTDGSLIYPRFTPGSEPGVMFYGTPFPFTVDWFRYAVYDNKTWDAATITLDDMAYASKKNPGSAETFNTDLSKLKKSGTKLLHYHGLADGLITSDNSARYYNLVLSTMKATPKDLDPFYRYFRIAGMGHCGGGVGATDIGGRGGKFDPKNPAGDLLSTIVNWVENGVAPETLTGKSMSFGAATSATITRKHCRYPLTNRFKGGDAKTSDASSWECVPKK